MRVRTLVFVLVCGLIWAGSVFYYSAWEPEVSPSLAVSALNGGDAEASRLRAGGEVHNAVSYAAIALTLGSAWVCFGPTIRGAVERRRNRVRVWRGQQAGR